MQLPPKRRQQVFLRLEAGEEAKIKAQTEHLLAMGRMASKAVPGGGGVAASVGGGIFSGEEEGASVVKDHLSHFCMS